VVRSVCQFVGSIPSYASHLINNSRRKSLAGSGCRCFLSLRLVPACRLSLHSQTAARRLLTQRPVIFAYSYSRKFIQTLCHTRPLNSVQFNSLHSVITTWRMSEVLKWNTNDNICPCYDVVTSCKKVCIFGRAAIGECKAYLSNIHPASSPLLPHDFRPCVDVQDAVSDGV
jgi:hypothetical protein